MTTPVVLIVFNRPDLVCRQIETLRTLEFPKLYVIADGPRNADDEEKCRQVRELIDSELWACDVEKNYAEQNLGCGKRIVTGLDWVFSKEERAIILEDDCVANADFFRFCNELLERYADDDRVAQICGTNALQDIESQSSYRFSEHAVCWGWATWARAWRWNDLKIDMSRIGLMWLLAKRMKRNLSAIRYWQKAVNDTQTGKLDTWDYQWQVAWWRQNCVAIAPNRNLVSNQGFGADATHTKSETSPMANRETGQLTWPLKHPSEVRPDGSADAQLIQSAFGG